MTADSAGAVLESLLAMGRIRKVLYIAAHGGYAGELAPLGGGAAVFDLLTRTWTRTEPFELRTLTPSILGAEAPSARRLVGFSEGEYAGFCDAFRARATEAALEEDPATTALLINDVSEGPDFARLRKSGYRMATIYHVDVVAYIAAIYLRGRLSPRALTRVWRALGRAGIHRIAPSVLRLIFEQQAASLKHSQTVVVPSAGMKRILLDCYPGVPPERIRTVPWGAPAAEYPVEEVAKRVLELRQKYGLVENARVLLCLSRISPEKGQDTLIEALAEWEQRPDFPTCPIHLLVCGEPAFMMGAKFARKLYRLAAGLGKVRVAFPGYVSGVDKQAHFALADLYVFPSRHESYGLTLMEALATGLPAVALDQPGSREIIEPRFGAIAPAGNRRQVRAGLVEAIRRHLELPPQALAMMRRSALEFAAARPFETSAARLASILHDTGTRLPDESLGDLSEG